VGRPIERHGVVDDRRDDECAGTRPYPVRPRAADADVDRATGDLAAADVDAARCRRADLMAAGHERLDRRPLLVLDSSSYSSLHPGYLVVFAGVYGSEDAARRGESVAHSHGFPGAYRRPITP
jgi:hypothetical protein